MLARLSAFVPALAAANAQLPAAQPGGVGPASDVVAVPVDDEADDENDGDASEDDSEEAGAPGPHVSMELACGVVDLLDAKALEAAEKAIANGNQSSAQSDAPHDNDGDTGERRLPSNPSIQEL